MRSQRRRFYDQRRYPRRSGCAVIIGAGLLVLLAGVASAVEPIILPAGMTVTAEKIELGRRLFFEKRLSSSGTVSCASCHDPAKAWADPGKRVSDGVRGRTSRNSPTIIAAARKRRQFWDGRADTVVGQAGEPLRSTLEMGHPTVARSLGGIAGDRGYQQEFARVFGAAMNTANVREAIAAFETSVDSTDAPMDRAVTWRIDDAGTYRYRVEPAADAVFDASQRRGLETFLVRCTACHAGADGRREGFANTGLARAYGGNDRLRSNATGRGADNRRAAIPTLREVQATAPYGHAGQISSLEAMVGYYGAELGRVPDGNLDPRLADLRQRGLTADERKDLVAFLKTAWKGTVTK